MRIKALEFGPFPHELVNRTLNMELTPGGVYVSVRALTHIQEDHPQDFDLIHSHLPGIVQTPTYVGQSPLHSDNMEFIKRI